MPQFAGMLRRETDPVESDVVALCAIAACVAETLRACAYGVVRVFKAGEKYSCRNGSVRATPSTERTGTVAAGIEQAALAHFAANRANWLDVVLGTDTAQRLEYGIACENIYADGQVAVAVAHRSVCSRQTPARGRGGVALCHGRLPLRRHPRHHAIQPPRRDGRRGHARLGATLRRASVSVERPPHRRSAPQTRLLRVLPQWLRRPRHRASVGRAGGGRIGAEAIVLLSPTHVAAYAPVMNAAATGYQFEAPSWRSAARCARTNREGVGGSRRGCCGRRVWEIVAEALAASESEDDASLR